MLDPKTKYLRQITSGEIYGYDPEFAKRSDMVPYVPGQDISDVEVLTIDTRASVVVPAPVEAVVTSHNGLRSGSGVMGAILGNP